MSASDLTSAKSWIVNLLGSEGFGSDYTQHEVDAWAADLREALDWRVLGGVIPGPIPVEWVQVGDTIQDHGVTGTITRTVRSGGMVHLVIGSGHVSFAKVARQDFITVLSSGGDR